MQRTLFMLSLAAAATLPTAAMAYVGPGAGLSLLGALWALIAAVGVALFFVVAWPVRKMLRKRRAGRAVETRRDDEPSPEEAMARSRANGAR